MSRDPLRQISLTLRFRHTAAAAAATILLFLLRPLLLLLFVLFHDKLVWHGL